VDNLSNLGLLDRTILIIGSDHGQNGNPLKRLPFIIRFPHGQYAGRIQANVQNLDIAPTVLDYISVDQPDWMRGQSLIAGELDQRQIFGANLIKGENPNINWVVNWEELPAPFYQFGDITLIYCQKWFRLDLTNMSWESGNVEGSTSACQPDSEITDEKAFQWIVEHLKENGFDVSTLDHFSP
jgi:arylsulfatase A-like enzyme